MDAEGTAAGAVLVAANVFGLVLVLWLLFTA